MKSTIIFRDDSDLRERVVGYNGCSMATAITRTEPKCTVKSRATKESFDALFSGKILCTSMRYVTVGNNYRVSVNNRLSKEGKTPNFEACPLPWGEWVPGSKVLIQHKGETYLRVYYLNANSGKTEKIYHYDNGECLSDELAERLKVEFLPVESKETRQGTDDVVIVNTIKLSSIVRLSFDGTVYVRNEWVRESETMQAIHTAIEALKAETGLGFATLQDIYRKLSAEKPSRQSHIRFMLCDKTSFNRVGEAEYDIA